MGKVTADPGSGLRVPWRRAAAIVALAVVMAGCSSAASPSRTPSATCPAAGAGMNSASGPGAVPDCGHVTARFKVAPAAAEVTGIMAQYIGGWTVEGLAYGSGSIWATDRSGSVVRFDPSTQKVVATIADYAGFPITDATGAGSVYVANWASHTIDRIDPATNAVAATAALSGAPYFIAVIGNAVWVSTDAGEVDVLDAATLASVATYTVGSIPGSPVIVGDGIWYPDHHGSTVNRLDLKTGQVTATVQDAGADPLYEVLCAGSLWVDNLTEGRVVRIDPTSARITATIPVPGTMLYGMTVYGGLVWVASTHEKALFAIDPGTDKVVGRVALGGEPMQVMALGNDLWVSIGDTGELVRVSVP
jgi:YVTN family beta-propeller protein